MCGGGIDTGGGGMCAGGIGRNKVGGMYAGGGGRNRGGGGTKAGGGGIYGGGGGGGGGGGAQLSVFTFSRGRLVRTMVLPQLRTSYSSRTVALPDHPPP